MFASWRQTESCFYRTFMVNNSLVFAQFAQDVVVVHASFLQRYLISDLFNVEDFMCAALE